MRREGGCGHREAGQWAGLFGAYPLGWDDPRRAFVNCYNDGGDGGGAGTGGGSGSGSGVGADAPKYTEADLDAIIARKIGEERSKFERKYGIKPEEREELDRLRAADKERQTKAAEAAGEWDRLKKSMTEEHERALGTERTKSERATGELRTERIRRALVSAAAKADAIDPEEVADLLERRCRLNDEFAVEVLDEQGQRAYRGADPMTPAQLVDAYLGKKPHLVKAGSTGQGGGSKGGASVSGERRTDTPDLQKAREAYEAAMKQAKESGAPMDASRALAAQRKVQELETAAAGK